MTPKTINARFQEYMDATYPNGLPESAKVHIKQAVFSGVMMMITLIEETENKEDAQVALLEGVIEELKSYAEERGVDLGGKN